VLVGQIQNCVGISSLLGAGLNVGALGADVGAGLKVTSLSSQPKYSGGLLER
jgi:hypothetical protein